MRKCICSVCRKEWGISRKKRIPRKGYVCPVCTYQAQKRQQKQR